MPSPSTSTAVSRPDIGGSMMEYDLELNVNKLVALQIFPVFESVVQAGSLGIIPLEQLMKAKDTKRANTGGYNRGEYDFKNLLFSTDENGWEERVDDREARMYGNLFDVELIAAQRARHAVMQNHEIRVTALATDASIPTGAATTAWTTVATAVPITDARTAILAVQLACGVPPNVMVISWRRFQSLISCAQIVDRIKYSGLQDPNVGAITEAAIASAMGVQRVIVAGAMKDTTNEGQTSVLASVWPDTKVLFAVVADSNDLSQPTLGRTIHYSADGSAIGGVMETYRDEPARSDIVRHRMDTDELLFYPNAGYVLTGA